MGVENKERERRVAEGANFSPHLETCHVYATGTLNIHSDPFIVNDLFQGTVLKLSLFLFMYWNSLTVVSSFLGDYLVNLLHIYA